MRRYSLETAQNARDLEVVDHHEGEGVTAQMPFIRSVDVVILRPPERSSRRPLDPLHVLDSYTVRRSESSRLFLHIDDKFKIGASFFFRGEDFAKLARKKEGDRKPRFGLVSFPAATAAPR